MLAYWKQKKKTTTETGGRRPDWQNLHAGQKQSNRLDIVLNSVH